MAEHKTHKRFFLLPAVAFLLGVFALLGLGMTTTHAKDTRTLPETGQTIKSRFLTYWNNHGSLAEQGYPITEELQEQNETDGKTYMVQYFQRAVFEYHLEQADPNYRILLSLLGVDYVSNKHGVGGPTSLSPFASIPTVPPFNTPTVPPGSTNTPTPTPGPSNTPTPTPTVPPGSTNTPTPTPTVPFGSTDTPTLPPGPSNTPTPTPTVPPGSTNTPTPTPTVPPSNTPTVPPGSTNTPTPTPTVPFGSTDTPTPTPGPSNTPTPTPTVPPGSTNTPTPTPTVRPFPHCHSHHNPHCSP